MNTLRNLFFLLLLIVSLAGCRADETSHSASSTTALPEGDATFSEDALRQELDTLEETLKPAQNYVITPEASGTHITEEDCAIIDYSNITDGYVMIRYKLPSAKKIKSQIVGPTTTYTYNLTPEKWEVFPLSDGNGCYQVNVFENLEGTRYLQILSADLTVDLEDEFAPFIRPNQYVNYENAALTIETAASLTNDTTDVLEKVKRIYDYIIHNITYDTAKASSVTSGYLPDLDAVLTAGSGICFDYASLMAGMLRSQGVPCKLIVGYADTIYHAWISVWSEKTGWVDGVVFFNGVSWQLMDPTYAASGTSGIPGNQSSENTIEYTSKYIY